MDRSKRRINNRLLSYTPWLSVRPRCWPFPGTHVEPCARAPPASRAHGAPRSPPPSLPVAPRPFARPKLLVLFVVELVVQIVVFVEVVQILLVKLVLFQLVVEVLVQVLVLFEVFELLVVETVAATLDRPVRRLAGPHLHPHLWLRFTLYEPS